MIKVMDAGFRYFYKEAGFGPIVDSTCVPQIVLARYAGRLPNRLLDYWRLYGWAIFGEGLFRFVDPAEHDALIALWLAGTPFENKDRYHVIARSAFGELFLWGEHSADSLTIQTLHGQIFPSDRTSEIGDATPEKFDRLLEEFMGTLDREYLDVLGDDDELLFQRLQKREGRLKGDEIYGRTSKYLHNYQCSPEQFRKMHAVNHMSLLAKIGERHVMQDLGEVLQNARLRQLM